MEGGGRSFELGDMMTAWALGQSMWAIACGAFVGKAAVRVGAMAFTAKGKAIARWKGLATLGKRAMLVGERTTLDTSSFTDRIEKFLV